MRDTLTASSGNVGHSPVVMSGIQEKNASLVSSVTPGNALATTWHSSEEAEKKCDPLGRKYRHTPTANGAWNDGAYSALPVRDHPAIRPVSSASMSGCAPDMKYG